MKLPPRVDQESYVEDFSAVPPDRYAVAQASERRYWSSQSRLWLIRCALRTYAQGFYAWKVHRALTNPFRVESTNPANFGLLPENVAGAVVVDVGCGPMSQTLSLVHCATVHVVDPLVAFYRRLQPFGWWAFESVNAQPAEALPFEAESVDIVHCRNVLDHTRAAHQILSEVARVLRPGGTFLLNCDLREVGAGPSHPYRWDRDVLEKRIFASFEPMMAPALIPAANELDESGLDPAGQLHWVCRLKKR